MYLKALEIQGFKSFPDKTKITFDTGITAVVGPNGSGKSNISDAIRWVLGETSVKQLRGGGKMENVIFGGTASRNAMGYTSVQLILDNTDHRLDVDAPEVTIGRKYYRSGESEYSINGQSVRLRDVYELLLDTGLGRDGYSIIGQGRIAEIVGNKSTERREIFEEASGIARFRYRKNEAERRLASAEENLVRLRDIMGELESRVGPLEKEAGKAQKFLEYSQEKKTLEVTLWVDTLHGTREGLRGQQRKIDAAEADYRGKAGEIEKLDAETLDIRAEIERLIIEIEEQGEVIRTLQEEIAGHDSHVAVTRNMIANNEARIAELEAEIAAGGSAAEENEKDIALQRADIARAEAALAETEEKIAALEANLAEIQQKSLATGERRGQVTARLAEASDRITSVRVQQASAASTTESAAARYETEKQSLQTVEDDLAALEKQKADTEDFLKTTAEELTKLDNIKAGLELKLAARQKALADADENERAIQRQAENASQRVQMLRDLERNLDGFQQSVKGVVNAARHGKLRGIIGPVSTILSVRSGYEVAVETALGYAMQNVVVEDESAAKAAMAYLKQTNGGRATFLPLDTVKSQRMDTSKLPAGAVTAQSLVKYDPKYENIASSLLARIVVVEDINEAGRTARSLDYRNRVVTRDGQVINAGGSFTGGSVSRSAGMFSRKQEIEDLEAKLKALDGKQKAAEDATDKAKAEVDALSAELTATNSEAITAGGDKIRCETELSRINQSIEAAGANRARLAAECETLSEQIAEAKNQHTLAETEQKRLSVEIEKLTAELAGITGDDDGFLAEREALTAQLGQLRMDALNHERDADLHRQRIETLQSQGGERAAQNEVRAANIERLRAENADHQASIAGAGAEKEQRAAEILRVEGVIKEMRTQRLEKEGSIRGQEDRKKALQDEWVELAKEIERLSVQKSSMEERYETTVAQLWEEYELTPTAAEALCVPIGEGCEYPGAAELRRRVGELRNKIRNLGNVNVGAIEEFAEVSERYTFLKAQIGDVEESKRSLEKMIAELSAEMTAMFSESFGEINRHFGRIFTELFGGGKAALTLTDPDDLLESGIEIEVAPPGKIIKDLSALSGGEQALVAICIYFAILAVNPAPFCVLDEIEAALDDANITRFAQYLRRICGRTQFIAITHRRGTMEEADVLYGVTMQEDGVSKLLKLNVADVDASLVR
ncbi:chromosome segregation protein SMC [Ruminococcaceae bacterium OttesenSCG-928-A11]|nr:chromosome segregation protein SMC [Ruminococcaceae bacterium OttesenSCG-928-A11]